MKLFLNGSVNINDSILINNLYEILVNEYGFKYIFNRIGISPKLNLNSDEIKKIKDWIKINHTGANSKIELIKQLESFRDISADPRKFNIQAKSVVKLYKSIIDIFDFTKKYNLEFLDYKEHLKYLETSQNFIFEKENFKRDNLVHQLRVFLLGSYIINTDKDFWMRRVYESIKKDLPFSSHILFGPKLSNVEFRLKSLFFAWMILSLFHDVGRSIEDANKTMNGIKEQYKTLPKFRWGYYRDFYGIKKFCEFDLSNLNIEPNEIGTKKINGLFKFLRWVRKDKKEYIESIIKNEFEKRDHGAISAILSTDSEYLEKNELFLTHFVKVVKEPVAPFFFLLIHYSFISISLHNNQRYFFVSPLTQLLIAADTLQEWDRLTKIGDNKRLIYPCDRIELKLDYKLSSNVIIKSIIPFEKPGDILSEDIFNRRETDQKKLFEELLKSKDEKELNDFFENGLELRIGFLETNCNEIHKLMICGKCGRTTVRTEKNDMNMDNLICSNCGV